MRTRESDTFIVRSLFACKTGVYSSGSSRKPTEQHPVVYQCPVMDRVVKLFLTASLLSCSCRCSNVEVKQFITAIEGNCVVVPCSTSPYTYVNWYKYQRSGYPPVYSRDSTEIIEQFRGRTSVLGNATQGNCSLKIDNVRQEDNGITVYAWINPDKIYGSYTELKVLAPSETHISVNSTQVEGKVFSASCTIQHSCPVSPPQLEWLSLSSVSNKVTTTQDSEGLWVTVAHAQFNASRQDQGKRLSCRRVPNGNPATGDAFHVTFPPSILSDSACWEREGALHCMCRVEAEPIASISWTVDGRSAALPHFTITENYTEGITVSLITGLRGHNITCKASNYLGSDTYLLSVPRELSGGSFGLDYLILLAVSIFIIMGTVVGSVVIRRLKKRQHSKSALGSLQSGTQQVKIEGLNSDVNVYVNDPLEENIYNNM